MSHLINIVNDKNEEILSNTFSTIPDYRRQIDRNQELWCLGDFNQDSIFSHQLELDQFQMFDELANFHFKKIELDCEREPDPQLCDSVLVFESMLTPGPYPTWTHFLSQH